MHVQCASMSTFHKQLRSPKTPKRSEKSPATPIRTVLWQNLRSPATTPAKDRRIPTTPTTPTRESTWQRQAMAAMVARTPSKATPPRSRSAQQRHEAKNGDVVARTTRELEHASGEVAMALRTERAAAYASTGNFEEALADLAAALALSKNGAKASIHFLRGEVLAKLERSEEAIEAYSACLAENPSHARAAFRRAACRNPLDARAADDYEAALALDAAPLAAACAQRSRPEPVRAQAAQAFEQLYVSDHARHRLVFGRDVRDIEMCSETDFGPTDYLEVVYGKESAISASRRVVVSSLHPYDSCPSHDDVGGLSFDFEAVRTASRDRDAPRRCRGLEG